MRSWCFDSVATEVDGVITYDREYGSSDFREVMRKLVGDGVYANPTNNMQVVPAGELSVAVQPGYCWVMGALGIVDEAETLTLDAATGNRVDVIVARFDLSLAARDIHLAVVKGTNGSNVAPTLTRNDSVYELQLARVQLNASTTNITMSAITDTRFDANLCGIVTGVIDQIDATDLFVQYEDTFNKFMNELEDVLTGDVAGNLLVQINNHTSSQNNPHNVTAAQIGLGNVLDEAQYCRSNPPELKTVELASGTAFVIDIGYSPNYILARSPINGGLGDTCFPMGLAPIGQGETKELHTLVFTDSGSILVYKVAATLSGSSIKISKGLAVTGNIEYVAF